MDDTIDYKVEPQSDGQKVRIARDSTTGEVLDAQALPPKRLRHKALERRGKKR